MNIRDMLRKFSVQITVLTVIILGVVGGISIFLLSSTEKQTQQQTISQEVIDAKIVDGCIDALMRSWRITDACHDAKNNYYLVKIADHPPENGAYDSGWWLLNSFKFIELQNGTYVIESVGQMANIDPDTTGLVCKQQIKLWESK